MAELADAHGSGPCESNFMEVRVLLPAPFFKEVIMADFKQSVSITSDSAATVIGPKTGFKGNITTDKSIRIEGKFEGDINSEDVVIVSETGYFKGTVKCREFDLQGEADGSITCTELMRFALSGKFRGDVTTANIDIKPGSDFDGNLKILK